MNPKFDNVLIFGVILLRVSETTLFEKDFSSVNRIMRKGIFLLVLFIAFSINASAQFADFPAGYSAIPKIKLKGIVHTVLTIEQRSEYVFETYVEVYDKNGRLIEGLRSNANIEEHSNELFRSGGKSIYIYDSSDKLVKEKYFEPDGEYTGYLTYIYDSKNFLVEEVRFDAKGKETSWKTTYTYFPEKREVEVKWSTTKILLSYNEKNQWTKRTEYDSSSKSDRYISFDYDAQGNFIKNSKGNYWWNYSYKYDKQDNWIERRADYVELGKDGKEEVSSDWMRTYRVITYYSDNEIKP